MIERLVVVGRRSEMEMKWKSQGICSQYRLW